MTFQFTITVVGVGDSEAEAWEDAKQDADKAVYHNEFVSIPLDGAERDSAVERYIKARSASILYDAHNSTSLQEELESLLEHLAEHLPTQTLLADAVSAEGELSKEKP